MALRSGARDRLIARGRAVVARHEAAALLELARARRRRRRRVMSVKVGSRRRGEARAARRAAHRA